MTSEREEGESSGDSATAVATASLVALTVLSPWPFGSASDALTGLVTAVAAAAGGTACVLRLRRGGRVPVIPAVWPLLGLVALGLAQLVPLPRTVHSVLAPGSARVWHPVESAAADVLGAGARPVSVHPKATWRSVVFASALLGLGVLAAPGLSRRRSALVAAVVVAIGGFATAMFGLVSHLVFANKLYGQFAVPTVSPYGSFVSKNHFAGYVEMAAILTLGLSLGLAGEARRSRSALSWIESRRAGAVLAAFGAAATMGLAVLVCQSRGGFLAIASGLSSLALLRASGQSGKRGRSVAIGLLALATAAVVSFLVLPAGSRERLQGLRHSAEDAAGTFRLATWRDTLRASGASPALGWGLGAFSEALPAFKTSSGELRIEHAENDYLELLLEGGLVGLGLAGVAVVLWARGLLAIRRKEEGPLLAALGTSAISGMIALFVHGLVDFNLHIPSNALLFTLLAALTAGAQLRSVPPPARCFPAAVGAVALAVVFLSSAFTASIPARPDIASVRDRSAKSLRSRQVEKALGAHLGRRPADAEAWVLLGWLRSQTGSRAEGVALARHGAHLDPQRKEVVDLARRLASLMPGALPE